MAALVAAFAFTANGHGWRIRHRRRSAAGNMAIEHRHKALGIGRIAGFDDDIVVPPVLQR
jgi:hypothetical protein